MMLRGWQLMQPIAQFVESKVLSARLSMFTKFSPSNSAVVQLIQPTRLSCLVMFIVSKSPHGGIN